RDGRLGLITTLETDRSTVEVGDFLGVTVTLHNQTGNRITDAGVLIDLPLGFAYLPGSATLNGRPIADPNGRSLVFEGGSLASAESQTFRFFLTVGPSAPAGNGRIAARASALDTPAVLRQPQQRVSRPVSVTVGIDKGIFADEGIIFGTVYRDCNLDGQQQPGEAGIGGARIHLQNGRYVVTDPDGLYSLANVQPGTNVLRLDPLSVPDGATVSRSSPRDIGEHGTRIASMSRGELHRADFPLALCPEVSRVEPLATPSESGLTDAGDVDRDRQTTASPRPAPPPPAERQASGPLRIVTPLADEVLPAAQTGIVIEGPLSVGFRVSVNGTDVPDLRIGRRTIDRGKRLQSLEYVGVPLVAGRNEITATMIDSFGIPRAEQRIVVYAPGPLAEIRLAALEENVASATGPARLIEVTLLDAALRPVEARTPVTLTASAGTFAEEDLDPDQPGLQVFIEGGGRTFTLAGPTQSQPVTVGATSGTVRSALLVDQVNIARPVIAVGVLEGQ
ncbi:MAG: hypothetical protein R3349_12840, partial [Geminicoccaceae bacterium]|nr:hypothetical protein [Geminicoccaceae bacterium]